jgi:two-component system, chemotaxis family, response regulator Rcp1
MRSGTCFGGDVASLSRVKQVSVHEGSLRRRFEILLVEDSPTDVLLATEALEDANVANNLHVVRDGVAATAFLHRGQPYANAPRPDLILLDLNLPKKDGRELLAEIKADPNVQEIPVIVLTTSKADEDVTKSYANHANCYITKPVDFEHFAQVVRQVVSFWFAVATLPPRCS